MPVAAHGVNGPRDEALNALIFALKASAAAFVLLFIADIYAGNLW